MPASPATSSSREGSGTGGSQISSSASLPWTAPGLCLSLHDEMHDKLDDVLGSSRTMCLDMEDRSNLPGHSTPSRHRPGGYAMSCMPMTADMMCHAQ